MCRTLLASWFLVTAASRHCTIYFSFIQTTRELGVVLGLSLDRMLSAL